jgi:predicted phage terminase large subunit-like protein
MRVLDIAKIVRPSYIADRAHEIIAAEVEKVVAGEQDLLVSCPPGSGKTELISIITPTAILAQQPTKHVIALANSDTLARLASSNVLRNLRGEDLQERFPLSFDKEAENSFTISGNDGRPSMHAAGIQGQLTGQRADFLIFDDLLKNLSEAYSETIRERVWQQFLSCAETRLLPRGRIIGIQTRWHLDDPIGRLLKRAQDNKHGRQFVYVSLAAWNDGTQSFILNTRTGEQRFFPPYRQLATIPEQPYSFSREQLESKKADLGPVSWAALYMQNPVAADNQMFPPRDFQVLDTLNVDQIMFVVSAWDTGSKTGAMNDPSCNVVVAVMADGSYLVTDCYEVKLGMDLLPAVVVERHRMQSQMFKNVPLIVIEDAGSGIGLIQFLERQNVPVGRAKAVKSKPIRAMSIQPYTAARSVFVLKGSWNDQFIADLANFPVSPRDHSVDAFVHAMRAMTTTGEDFEKPKFKLTGGRYFKPQSDEEVVAEIMGPLRFSVDPGPEDF